MKTFEPESDFENIPKGCVLTIGNFDGVHLGHQQILTAAKRTAAERQTQLLAMTFEPHPLAVINPQKKPGILTPLPLKKCLLRELAVDYLLIVRTTPRLLALSPHDYVREFLVQGVRPSVVVEGESFNFGAGRAGTIQTLQNFAADQDFEVFVIPTREVNLSDARTVNVSSTVIRSLLEAGRVADAAIALARPYRLIGQVVPGRGKGKQLGFPTANLQPGEQLIPNQGVYAGFVAIADSTEQACKAAAGLPAAISIGRAETLRADSLLLVEAHILTGEVPDLHGKSLAVDLVGHLRSQQKFETVSDLAKQIAEDCKKARRILAKQD